MITDNDRKRGLHREGDGNDASGSECDEVPIPVDSLSVSAATAEALPESCGLRRSPRIAAAAARSCLLTSFNSTISLNISSGGKRKNAPKVQRSSSLSKRSCSGSSNLRLSDSVFDTSLSPILRENSVNVSGFAASDKNKDKVQLQTENDKTKNAIFKGSTFSLADVKPGGKRPSPRKSKGKGKGKARNGKRTSISSISSMQDTSMACPETSMVKKRKRKQRYSNDEDDDLSFFQTLKRKKRKNSGEEDDTLSVKSFSLRSSFRLRRQSKADFDTLSLQSFTMGTGQKHNKSLVKVTSLANILSPMSSVKKVGQALQRSMSFKGTNSGGITIKPYCKPQATPTKRRDSKLWSETVKGNINEALTKIEIKRQEAIFELFQGEVDLVDDLYLVMKVYRDAMKSLQILTRHELNTIFGSLEELRQLHEELVCELQRQRRKNGTTEEVGNVLLNWLPTLREVYVSYCANQLAAKTLLDEKKQDSKVNDFLERCIESPFSRKLDLWNFLDVPRSRLVKYPLLMKSILRATPGDHQDKILIPRAIQLCEEIVSEVDRRTGETKCRHYIDHLEFLDEKQRNHLIQHQKVLLCGGVLKSTKGAKLHVFLFEDILVVTRLVSRSGRQGYQVYRQPIPVRTMAIEDIPDGEVRRSGSFRGALSHGPSVKCGFKVRSTDANLSQSFTLLSSDEHDKKQWLQLMRGAIKRARQDETSV